MAAFKKGNMVKILCEVQPGAFPGEKLVTIKTEKGEISGFVKSNLVIVTKDNSYVGGQVIEVTSDHIKVRFPGSFFTTASGLATASRAWASDNLQPLQTA